MDIYTLLGTFWAEHERAHLNKSAIALYFRLIYEANRCFWKGPLTLSWEYLGRVLGFSPETLGRAISDLKSRGLITYERKGKHSTFWFPNFDNQSENSDYFDNRSENSSDNINYFDNRSRNRSGNRSGNRSDQDAIRINNNSLRQEDSKTIRQDIVSPNGDMSSQNGEDDNNARKISVKSKEDRTPYQKLVDLYHQLCPSLPKVKMLNETRRRLIRARWREHPDMDFWVNFFKRVEASDFLCGRVPPRGDRPPFIADFEWIIRPNNSVKILEGRYDNRKPPSELDLEIESLLNKWNRKGEKHDSKAS